MRKIVFALLTLCMTASAQTFYEDGYQYIYDYDHRVVVHQCIACTEDYQDLWNGDYVRIINDYVYIYRNGTRITYGDRIWLEHTGDYTVERGDYMYLMDEDGNRWGASGKRIELMWNKVCKIKLNNGYWYLYRRNGTKMGNVYSDEEIGIYWNGYYCYHTPDGYYRVADEDGMQVPNSYSDEEPTLMTTGNFRCMRGGKSYIINTDGRRVY